MTRFVGLRFEAEYREPGCEPFRFDHPTVGVGVQPVRQAGSVARELGLDDRGDALFDLLRVEEKPYRHDAHVHRSVDRFRLEPDEVAHLRSVANAVVDAVADAVDLDDVRADLAATDDDRDAVGAFRYDARCAHDRCRDLVALCDVALERGVALAVA